MHQGSYLSDTLFYPEPHIPVERVPQGDGLDPLRPALQPAPGGGDQEGGQHPGHDGVRLRRRLRRPGHRRGQDRLRRLQPPPLRRRRVSRQDAHRPGPRSPALHQVRPLQQHLQRAPALPHQRLLRHRVLRPDPARRPRRRSWSSAAVRPACRPPGWRPWRGHDVSLWEKGKYLGGSMSLAAMVKGFKIEDVREVIWFLRRQVKKYGVDVQLGKEIDAAAIEAAKPDVVIIAAGGKPTLPDVPGVYGKNVVQEQRPLRHAAVLPAPARAQDPARPHQHVDAGGQERGHHRRRHPGLPAGRVPDQAGPQGHHRRHRGRTRQDDVSRAQDPPLLLVRQEGRRAAGRRASSSRSPTRASRSSPRRARSGSSRPTAWYARCRSPATTALEDALQGKVPEVYSIGDCDEPGLIPDATSAGWKIGNASRANAITTRVRHGRAHQAGSRKVGISAEQAEQAVNTVLGFLKDKLPEPIAGQLDNVVGGRRVRRRGRPGPRRRGGSARRPVRQEVARAAGARPAIAG